MTAEQFMLQWTNHYTKLSTGFNSLLEEKSLLDVTLAAGGQVFQAHKVVLSVCSPYFRQLFQVNPCKHPIVILRDVEVHELEAILMFIYKGEVSVAPEDLSGFLKVAEMLQISGLEGSGEKSKSVKETELSNLSNAEVNEDPLEEPPDKRRAVVPKQSSPLCSTTVSSVSGTDVKEEPTSMEFSDIAEKNATSINLGPAVKEEPRAPSPDVIDIDDDDEEDEEEAGEEAWTSQFETESTEPVEQFCNSPLPNIPNISLTRVNQKPVQSLPSETSQEILPGAGRINVSGSSSHFVGISPSNTKDNKFSQSQVQLLQGMNSSRQREANLAKLFKCNVCSQNFTLMANLMRHVRNMHGADKGPFSCPVCGQLKKNRRTLKDHISAYHCI